jgi:hypothetical protein
MGGADRLGTPWFRPHRSVPVSSDELRSAPSGPLGLWRRFHRGAHRASPGCTTQHARSTKTVLPVTVVWTSSWAPGVPESVRL